MIIIKKIKLISIIGIFILSFLAHFMYDWFPSIFISFFFPVNESIWEHMKIIYTSTLIYGIIDYALLKFNKIKFNNFSWQLFFTSVVSIIIFLIIFIPIYNIWGENLWVTLIIMFITYCIGQFISYFILRKKNYKYLNFIAIFMIIFIYVIFIILTYSPPKMPIFYDTLGGYYGIEKGLN